MTDKTSYLKVAWFALDSRLRGNDVGGFRTDGGEIEELKVDLLRDFL